MENEEFTSQIEYDGFTISVDLVASTWKTVAWIIAEPWEEWSIYSLDINKTEEDPIILGQLIKGLILEIQKTTEKSFVLNIKIFNFQTEKIYLEVVKFLQKNDLIDSYRFIKTKNTSESHLHLICE